MGSDIWQKTIQIAREGKSTAATSQAILSNQQQGIFSMHHPTDRIAHIIAFVTPIVKLNDLP